jgi:hypothetical protein
MQILCGKDWARTGVSAPRSLAEPFLGLVRIGFYAVAGSIPQCQVVFSSGISLVGGTCHPFRCVGTAALNAVTNLIRHPQNEGGGVISVFGAAF